MSDPLPTSRTPAEWRTQALITAASHYLVSEFENRYPEGAAIAHSDPAAAAQFMNDLTVKWVQRRPSGACDLGGTYEDQVYPAVATIHLTASQERNNFTLLHEIGHHLLSTDPIWAFDIRPSLAGQARTIEDHLVNAFASNVLLPDEIVNLHLQPVTAAGIVSLRNATYASTTACCVRAAGLPGERLVMLTRHGDEVLYADGNGQPYTPGKNVHQPGILKAAERAAEIPNKTAQITGGDGILYSTGRHNPNVRIDVAWYDHLVVAVVTATPPPRRMRNDQEQWQHIGDHCGHEFSLAESPGHCSRCGDWKCPECGSCGCRRPSVYCTDCFMELPVSMVEQGRSHHHPECP